METAENSFLSIFIKYRKSLTQKNLQTDDLLKTLNHSETKLNCWLESQFYLWNYFGVNIVSKM